ncbi:MAG: UDP-3-O-(3-hydroxymyristoyl)glucosamine N-acyltransferase [Fimbriimonadaceae bacterium]|jgi:UDP-3-O-[3-hydroxymyristoyl] glucosamine N-acyltransferase|nr:UDP-3-O-(3-hydroxymyristoyl)glucosamine N-acyltransferase [Fimbriimonadaceae bacterium]
MATAVREWSLGEIATFLGGQVLGDSATRIRRPVPAGQADPTGITFAIDEKFLRKAASQQVGGIIAPLELSAPGQNLVLVADPRTSFAMVLALMSRSLPLNDGIHPTAIIDPTATLDPTAQIGPYVVVSQGAEIGPGVKIYAQCYIGDQCRIGSDSILYPRVVLVQDVTLGKGCILHPGVVLGTDGFGFVWDGQNQVKVPQVGGVILEDGVEIGANTCIDRATCGETVIGKGTKLDNLIQIGHNCKVGANTVMAALVGISGSVTIGDQVTIGGQAAVSDHVTIGSNITLGGRTGVVSDLKEPGEYFGLPPVPMHQAMRAMALSQRLPDLFKRLRELEREVEKLRP